MNREQKVYSIALIAGLVVFLCLWGYLRFHFQPDWSHAIVSRQSTNTSSTEVPQLFEARPRGERLQWLQYRLDGVDGAMSTKTNNMGEMSAFSFGPANAVPMVGDYNGDGLSDYGSFSDDLEHTSTGDYHVWSIAYSSADHRSINLEQSLPALERKFGEIGDIPLSGDFDGDGKQDLAVYNAHHFVWRVAFSSTNFDIAKALAPSENGQVTEGGFHLGWGAPGLIPLTGDFDGNGVTDIALWGKQNITGLKGAEPSTALAEFSVFYLPKDRGKIRPGKQFPLGAISSIPLTGDIDCDGKADFITYDKQSAHWQMRLSKLGARELTWGLPNSEPLIQDFDGDGCPDLGLYTSGVPYCYQFLPSSLMGPNFKEVAWENSILTRISWCHTDSEPIEIIRRRYIFAKIIPLGPSL